MSQPPPKGTPSLIGCVARLDVGEHDSQALIDSLPWRLAEHFRGRVDDYKVALFSDHALAVFFPNWVERGSAIGHSPLCLDGVSLHFSDWVEAGEEDRGHLPFKCWIRLRNWPLCCWNTEAVTAAVSSFGELWEVDECSAGRSDVSNFRVLVRCRDADAIPATLLLTVVDRRFRISIEVESFEAAPPILLDETTDRQLGLDTWEDQVRFLKTSGRRYSKTSASVPSSQSSAGGGEGEALSKMMTRFALLGPVYRPRFLS